MILNSKRFWLSFLLLITFSFASLVLNARAQGGLGTRGEMLNPTSGPRGTTVTINFNITNYVMVYGSAGSTQDAYGTVYRIGWDIGGYPKTAAATLEEVRSPGWTVLGTVNVDRFGSITTTVRIPTDAQIGDEHYVYAIPPDMESSVYYWSDSFHVTEGPVVSPPSPTPHPTSNTLTINFDNSEFRVSVYSEVFGYEQVSGPFSHSYSWGTAVKLRCSYIGDQGAFGSVVDFSRWDVQYSNGTILKSYDSDTSVFMDGDVRVTPVKKTMCVIASATYGSPLASEVVFMRSVRDDMIGSNGVGSVLVEGWNKFYYSWSPPVAAAITGSDALKAVFSVALLPLLGTMHVVACQYSLLAPVNPVFASVSSFVTAAVLSISVYIVLPTWGLLTLYRHKRQGKRLSRLFIRGRTKS